jgi:hypothetical protein
VAEFPVFSFRDLSKKVYKGIFFFFKRRRALHFCKIPKFENGSFFRDPIEALHGFLRGRGGVKPSVGQALNGFQEEPLNGFLRASLHNKEEDLAQIFPNVFGGHVL